MNWFWRLLGYKDESRDLPMVDPPKVERIEKRSYASVRITEEPCGQPATDPKDIWAELAKTDLSPVWDKLAKTEGEAWTESARIANLGTQYLQFLYLVATAEGKPVVPWSEDLDRFWHAHILHTQHYTEMCMRVFGRLGQA